MTRFNQAIVAGASSIALFAGALTLITPAANAYDLYQDSWSHDVWDRPTYNRGDYTELDSDDWQRSNIYDSTLKDRDGNLYDCNNIGQCNSRW